MSIGGVGFQNFKYYGHIGVDNEGNPVYYDPKKVKTHKQPLFIDFDKSIPPEKREEIAKKIEMKIKQQEAIEKALKDHGKINPTKDKVFIDMNTGELTTWKPGIIDPHAEEKREAARKKAVGLAGALITAGLAFFFRGKIKAGAGKLLEAVKPYMIGALAKGKDLVKKGLGLAKPAIEKAGKAVKDIASKGAELVKPVVTYVKNTAGKAVTYLKNLVK